MQRLLRVAVGSFEVRIVVTPHHVVVLGVLDDLHTADVVLEGRVNLLAHNLTGQPAQPRPHEHSVLAVGLVHPVADRRHPPGSTFGNEHFQGRVPVKCTARDQVRDHSHAGVRRLHVVDHRTTRPAM